ncbi:MAG: glycosyltransferase family 1 protein [Microcystis aeruginosa DA14]|uniref:Glycosyltransferase family 1 protein n=1 Tax=Microcystis aeruginosa DA14 TaxID=1987506 RepID=A0A3E0M5U7_MICAE|nr:MAG: glycosyltransferase family 1 protein [Microcystis aeruginosa DA14]
MLKKTIGVYMPYFMGGGAESVALWILEALKEKYDLTLFTLYYPDWEKLNKLYETSLTPKEVKVVSVLPKSWQDISEFLISNNPHFRQISIHLSLRYLKERAKNYSLVLSACNAADLGVPGIQYIHWVKVLEGGKIHQNMPYLNISNFSVDNLKKNLSISNSFDVAKAVKEVYGLDSTVIYPPVVIPVKDIAPEQKENAFVISGRLTVDKSPDFGIKVLKAVRERGFSIKLHITGGAGGAFNKKYQHYIEQLVAENSDWIQLYKDLPYADYCNILYKCRYGIHPKKDQFGISVAEMVRADIIPFVQKIGGQTEIVGKHNTELQFNSMEEAVEKIIAVISNEKKQEELLMSLSHQKSLFSSEKFQREISQFVDNYFSDNVSET